MCIAIGQPADTNTLTIEQLERGWDTNPDGGGFAYIDEDGIIVTIKDMDKDSFILQYIEAHTTYGATSPFIVHMRIATHGSVSLANCHPFKVDLADEASEMVMMHNGIISKVSNDIDGTDLTDTEGLAIFVLSDLHDGWLDNAHLVSYIEDYIDYSKLVFLTTSPQLDKEMYILNESMGNWDHGVWFSNYSCFNVVKKAASYGSDSYSKYVTDQESDVAKAYGWFYNGVYHEGADTSWYIGDDDRRVSAQDMRNATTDEHIDIYEESMRCGDVCGVCTGTMTCICDELCIACYEAYHDCECTGDFASLGSAIMNPIRWHHDDDDIANGGWDKPILNLGSDDDDDDGLGVLRSDDKYDNVVSIKDNRDVPYDNDTPFADWLSEKVVNDTVPF